MKKILLSFLALAIAAFLLTPTYAADYTICDGTAYSNVLPIVPSASYASSATQQIYLASELIAKGASNGNIEGLTLYYGGKGGNTAVNPVERKIEIWLMQSDEIKYTVAQEGSQWLFTFLNDGSTPTPKAGTQVFAGEISTERIEVGGTKSLPITFNKGSFSWDGESNLILTVFDVTGSGFSDANLRFVATTSIDNPRFVHQYWLTNGDGSAVDYRDNLSNRKGFLYTSSTYSNSETGQNNYHKCVTKVTFSISAPVPSPTNLSSNSMTFSSATINWTAAAGADSYEVRYGTTSGSLGAATNVGNVTSYILDELEDETTYYYQVRTKIGSAYSTWTDEASFTTLAEAPHIHNGITFSKWNYTNSLPTFGNYYLANDVEISGYSNITLVNDLNLCLNGHNILTSSNCIIVPDGVTFAIYDNEGSGVIRGAYPGGWAESGLISIKDGGTLNISEGGVVNLANDANDYNLAIDNKGTLILSGAPTISGVKADIYLANSKVITINGALANTTPYKVNAVGQVITSGWSTHMSGEIPGNYFASAKSGYSGVVLSAGEAKLVQAVALSESDDSETFNSKISGKTGVETYISLTRSLTSAQYNTFCLPFALTDAQLRSVFGSSYDLEELTASSLDGETLSLEFTRRTALAAGKPYLLQPSANVTNPVFEGVTITATSPGTSTTDYVDYQAVYSPTSLAGGNRNLLFLGAGNELFWPESTGNLNGFRAYFEIKGAAAQAAKRARISMGGKIATGNLSPALPQEEGVKILRDGKLYLIYKGQMYDVQGKRI